METGLKMFRTGVFQETVIGVHHLIFGNAVTADVRNQLVAVQSLAEKSGNPDDAKVELHRPYIDKVTFKCPECGGTMKRVPEVIDCWFDQWCNAICTASLSV